MNQAMFDNFSCVKRILNYKKFEKKCNKKNLVNKKLVSMMDCIDGVQNILPM